MRRREGLFFFNLNVVFFGRVKYETESFVSGREKFSCPH